MIYFTISISNNVLNIENKILIFILYLIYVYEMLFVITKIFLHTAYKEGIIFIVAQLFTSMTVMCQVKHCDVFKIIYNQR